MNRQAVLARLPDFLRRRVLAFETRIEEEVARFAGSLPERALVLDAGAGEGRYSRHFARQRYVGVDLGIGDAAWNYTGLDAVADLGRLPFPAGCFDALLNIVTLEHVRDPAGVVGELGRVLRTGGEALLVVPQDWEIHQAPHDYFRYTRFGLIHLLEQAGFGEIRIDAAGGYFRLLSRRLLNGLQFFRGPWFWLAAIVVVPPALLLPWLDRLDKERNFTLGYLCRARKA